MLPRRSWNVDAARVGVKQTPKRSCPQRDVDARVDAARIRNMYANYIFRITLLIRVLLWHKLWRRPWTKNAVYNANTWMGYAHHHARITAKFVNYSYYVAMPLLYYALYGVAPEWVFWLCVPPCVVLSIRLDNTMQNIQNIIAVCNAEKWRTTQSGIDEAIERLQKRSAWSDDLPDAIFTLRTIIFVGNILGLPKNEDGTKSAVPSNL